MAGQTGKLTIEARIRDTKINMKLKMYNELIDFIENYYLFDKRMKRYQVLLQNGR